MRLNFKVLAKTQKGRARAGEFQTLHGPVKTPVFMPVGTFGSIHAQMPEDLKVSGSQVILGNTYHLWLRPGLEVFKKFGGLHRFMKWDHPILTDSGGFQIFSLPGSRKITEEGALFQSYVDGQALLLSPEKSIEIQRSIGSDIMMVLDQCLPSVVSKAEALSAMELTHRWAVRSLNARGDSPQALFGIVQGACFTDLRKTSADFVTNLPLDGFAIGGLAVGETKTEREDFTESTVELLPVDRPRYLMGVGTPLDLLEAVHRGVDMFDCIIPTLHAEQGLAYTSAGKLSLCRGVYKFVEEALDKNCQCRACRHFSKAYLHHLVKTKQGLAVRLLAEHNISFYHSLMGQMREAILENRFEELYHRLQPVLDRQDPEFPSQLPVTKVRKSKDRMVLGDFEIQLSAASASIRQLSSQETMHDKSNPNLEAMALYVDQSQLVERLKIPHPKPLIVWDVGLGAAHNAMAAVQRIEELAKLSSQSVKRDVELISFEKDLNPLKLALGLTKSFAHLKHSGPREILKRSVWSSDKCALNWRLIEGDFLESYLSAEAPDIIYYDPFSTKSNYELWTLSFFKKLHAHCVSKETSLYTYTSSTAARAALLGASFFVAKGKATGSRSESTVAYNHVPSSQTEHLLKPQWLERWKRSDAKMPLGLDPGEGALFEEHMLSHPQFLGNL